MRFGLFGGARTEMGEQASDSRIYTDYIDYICEAEALGFHSVFLVEHHFTGFGQISATLNFLTYLAAKTTTLRLGTAVLVLPWHNPALLAEQAATLDLLSNGRFDFGIGKGYRWGEFHGFCMAMEEAEERYQETVAFLCRAWTGGGRFSHHGKYWNYDDVVIEPAPVQKPHPPLWVGAQSPSSIRYAAENGFNLLLGQAGSPDALGDGLGAAGLPEQEVEAVLGGIADRTGALGADPLRRCARSALPTAQILTMLSCFTDWLLIRYASRDCVLRIHFAISRR